MPIALLYALEDVTSQAVDFLIDAVDLSNLDT